MMKDAIQDKGEEKEEENRKKGKWTDEARRNRGLDQAEGRDGVTAGLNKRRNREMVRMRLDTNAAGGENYELWTKWKRGGGRSKM